ncbi:ketopantoate reductase family protein [Maribacter luteus]|uniref:ketopantoate reductase family protein n=1 Tax=Maribacter luteus TaxID=2594478 RepID=UPI00248F6F46|nr:2-dehydropantoate 2-reductase [Maribacter luteus]
MKIAIIGTGGVGGYFGAKLAQAGFDVTFLARGEHLKAIQKNGLQVKSILGDFHVDHVTATDSIPKMGKSDLIILCVKAWQIKEISTDLKSIIHDDSMVLPLQNGILAPEELKETIDEKHILGGLCRIISKIESPGTINHFGVDPVIVFGELIETDTKRSQDLKALFTKAGIRSEISNDITSDLWGKFLAICVSGLLAVTKTTHGEIMELKETRQMMFDLLTEIYVLSQKVGVHLKSDIVDKTMAFIDSFPYESTTSLTRDVWQGRPSEIEYQNGTVVKFGEKYGVETPINKFVYHCILPMEIKSRKPKS